MNRVISSLESSGSKSGGLEAGLAEKFAVDNAYKQTMLLKLAATLASLGLCFMYANATCSLGLSFNICR